jgi:ribonuclease HI
MGKKNKRYYAVVRGGKIGIYGKWYGEEGAEAQINGYPNALYMGFRSHKEAEVWLVQQLGNTKSSLQGETKYSEAIIASQSKGSNLKKSNKVIIYTDGGCINNPGPGGYGIVLIYREHRKELSGGFKQTTNNRMELMACIMGLSALKRKCPVTIHSDSKYVVNGIKKGWAKRWQANGWMRNKIEYAENIDLWEKLLELCNKHNVEFKWVKGHSGNSENERCDQLAKEAVSERDLPPDTAYENGKTKVSPRLF